MAYAQTETQNASNKHAFWITLERAGKEVPKNEQLVVLVDATARTGRREKGGVRSKESEILGADGRDTLNDNKELLLSFADNHDLALGKMVIGTRKDGVSYVFNGLGKKRIDNILTNKVVTNSY